MSKPQSPTKPQSRIRKIRERNQIQIENLQGILDEYITDDNYDQYKDIKAIAVTMKTLIECESILSAVKKNKK